MTGTRDTHKRIAPHTRRGALPGMSPTVHDRVAHAVGPIPTDTGKRTPRPRDAKQRLIFHTGEPTLSHTQT